MTGRQRRFLSKILALFVTLNLTTSVVFAANPPAPFSPSDNVLDPGCLPTDSNCYVDLRNTSTVNATTSNLSITGTATLGGNLAAGTTSTITENVMTDVIASTTQTYNDGDKFIVVSPTDGFARFVFVDTTTWDKLYLTRCLNNDCTVSTTTVVVTDPNEPDFAEIAMGADNLPRISYINYASPNELHYVQCLNENCSSNNNTILATNPGAYYEQSLAVGPDGLSHIAYMDYSGTKSLRLINCLNNDCSSVSTTTLATTTQSFYPSVAVDSNNLVHVAYYNGASNVGNLYYLSCNDTVCSLPTTNLLSTNDASYYVSLALTSNNLPRIAYQNPSALKYAACSDILCASSSVTTLKSGLSFPQVSITLDSNDLARVTHADNSQTGYVQCLNASCVSKRNATLDSALYPASIAMGQDGLSRIIASTNSKKTITYIRLVADDGKQLVTGSSLGSLIQTLGSIFASKITTSLFDAGTGTIDSLTVNSSLNVPVINLPISNGSSTGVMYVNGERFFHTSGSGCDGPSNVFLGHDAGTFTVNRDADHGSCWWGSFDTAIGNRSMQSLTVGFENSAFGHATLNSATEGYMNGAFGAAALGGLTTGYQNNSFGDRSLLYITTGIGNSAFGHMAGMNLSATATSSYNSFFGHSAGANQISGDNNIAIGYNTNFASTTGSNQLNIGNFLYGTSINSNGKFGIGTSTPSESLTVDGNSIITGHMGVGSSASNDQGTVLQISGLYDNSSVNSGVNGITVGNELTGTGTLTDGFYGVNAYPTAHSGTINNAGAGAFGMSNLGATVTNLIGVWAWGYIPSGTTTNSIGVLADTISGGAMHATNAYGLKVNNQIGNVNSYAIYTNQSASSSPTASYAIYNNGTAPSYFAGSVGIGTTTPQYTLHVGNTTIPGVVARFENSTGYCDINPTTTSLTCTSDERLKKNIVTLDASTTLNNLRNLRAVTYNWKTEGDASSTHAGFIAQEVKPLFPDLVAQDPTGTYSVSYGGFIPYIIQSLQSILNMIDDFKNSFTTNELCVGTLGNKTCITKEKLDEILSKDTTQPTGAIIVPTVDTSSTSTDGTASTTDSTTTPVTTETTATTSDSTTTDQMTSSATSSDQATTTIESQ